VYPTPHHHTPKPVLRSLFVEGSPARPNARTFTILLAGIAKAGSSSSISSSSSSSSSSSARDRAALCVALYREAEAQGVECNGIMAHALLRAFGGDAPGALAFFKKELRVRLKALDKTRPPPITTPAAAAAGAAGAAGVGGAEEEEEEEAEAEDDGAAGGPDGLGAAGGHLSLAYLALLHVCGLAGRADLALQSVYAMQRDGIRADSRAWNAFASGKDAAAAAAASAAVAGAGGGAASEATSSLLMAPYESLVRAETLGGASWGDTFYKRIRIRF
jgi:hypothetical protein